MTHHKSTSQSSKSKSKSKSSKSSRDSDRFHSSTMSSSQNATHASQQGYGSTYSDAGSWGSQAAGSNTSQKSRAEYSQAHPGVAYQPYQHGAAATAVVDRVNSQFGSSGQSQPSGYPQHLNFGP